MLWLAQKLDRNDRRVIRFLLAKSHMRFVGIEWVTRPDVVKVICEPVDNTKEGEG